MRFLKNRAENRGWMEGKKSCKFGQKIPVSPSGKNENGFFPKNRQGRLMCINRRYIYPTFGLPVTGRMLLSGKAENRKILPEKRTIAPDGTHPYRSNRTSETIPPQISPSAASRRCPRRSLEKQAPHFSDNRFSFSAREKKRRYNSASPNTSPLKKHTEKPLPIPETASENVLKRT